MRLQRRRRAGIDGALGDANPNDTLLSTIDYADEFTLRLTYQF